MFRNTIVIIAAAAICLSAAAVRGDEQETIHRTFTLGQGGTVEVRNINGNVHISAWNESTVDLEAVKRTRYDREELDRMRIEIEETGNSLVVRTTHLPPGDENGSFFSRLFRAFYNRGPRGSVEYTLRVPRNVDVVVAKSVNGNVDLDGTGGDTDASTTNGSVIADDTTGRISASTTNGSVRVSGASHISEARSTNGNIDVSLASDHPDPVRLRTTNGSITIGLDPDMNADLNIHTVNGSVNAQGFSITLDRISRKEIRGSLGRGGIEIDASTVNGSVTLKRR